MLEAPRLPPPERVAMMVFLLRMGGNGLLYRFEDHIPEMRE